MREFAKEFYKSKAWKDCRAAYARHARGLCEICLARGVYAPGVIVHHKIHVEPETITDPEVLLNWDNLQLVCRQCHAQIHKPGKRYTVDEFGRVEAIG